MPYPPAPWHMHGQLWLSLFRVRPGDHPEREPGVYGVALVSYEEPSPLIYAELLVATPSHRRAMITDIWVDSPDSRDGGQELWAIPKGLADFRRVSEGGRLQRTSWDVTLEGRPVVSARFTDVAGFSPRLPFKGGTRQVRPTGHPDAGAVVLADLSGSGRSAPARAHWRFAREGPLGWLADKRSIGSVRMADFTMSFG